MVGIVSAMPAFVAWTQWTEVRALQKAWTVVGPPCPVVQQPAPWARGRKPPLTFTYGGAVFTRSFAAVSCAAVPSSSLWSRGSYYVCQFNNPGAVEVVTSGQRTIYQPPVGQRATVTIRDGASSCVVGGDFNI